MLTSKARIVFAVELEGSARKLVTIRSALQISNKLKHAVEIKMEKSLNQFGCRFACACKINCLFVVLLISFSFRFASTFVY